MAGGTEISQMKLLVVCLLVLVRGIGTSPVPAHQEEADVKDSATAARLLGINPQADNGTLASDQSVHAWIGEEQPTTGGSRGTETRNQATCHRKDFFIDFAQLGMAEWVLAPASYNARRCTGHCKLSLANNTRATNHAIIELLAQDHMTAGAADHQGPCCTPTKLAPLNVLVFEDGKVVYKQLSDMVVLECGCQ